MNDNTVKTEYKVMQGNLHYSSYDNIEEALQACETLFSMYPDGVNDNEKRNMRQRLYDSTDISIKFRKYIIVDGRKKDIQY